MPAVPNRALRCSEGGGGGSYSSPAAIGVLELINLCLSVRLREETNAEQSISMFWVRQFWQCRMSIRRFCLASDKSREMKITNGCWLEMCVVCVITIIAWVQVWTLNWGGWEWRLDGRHLQGIWIMSPCQMMSPRHMTMSGSQSGTRWHLMMVSWYQWPGSHVCHLQC